MWGAVALPLPDTISPCPVCWNSIVWHGDPFYYRLVQPLFWCESRGLLVPWRHWSQEFLLLIAIFQLLFVIFLVASIIFTAHACHIFMLVIAELQTVPG